MRLFSLFVGVLFLSVACGGGSETPPPPPPPATTTTTTTVTTTTAPPPPPPPATFATKSFPCCGAEHVRRVVEEYLDIAEGLAGLDNRLEGNLTAMIGSVKSGYAPLGPAEDAQLTLIEASANAMKSNKDLTFRRGEFKKMTAAVLALTRLSPGGTDYRLAEVYCAGFDGAWLTDKDTLINPYGAADLSCATYR